MQFAGAVLQGTHPLPPDEDGFPVAAVFGRSSTRQGFAPPAFGGP